MSETHESYGQDGAAKHAPGPWTWVQETPTSGGTVYAVDGVNRYICTTSGNVKGNTPLIATAPELLADLEYYYERSEGAWMAMCKAAGTRPDDELQRLIESGRDRLDKTAALIRKAKGGGDDRN